MTIYVPDLLIYEIANVLRYKPDLTGQQVRDALASLYDMQIRIVAVSRTLVMDAIQLAYADGIKVYDATFISLADGLKVPFATADEKLVQKVSRISWIHHLAGMAK